MGNRIFFSIIVPVYNVSEYLDDCIQSLINQSFQDFEALLIDDGSTDESSTICDRYTAAFADHFKTIHQKNRGLAAARNTGLSIASGEYILFLHSDDTLVDNEALAHLKSELYEANYPDIMLPPKNEIFANGKSGKKVLEIMFDNHSNGKGVDIVVWDKIYKREMIEKAKLRFIDGYVHEDIFWTPVSLSIAKQVNNCSEFVSHRLVMTSITRSRSQESIFSRASSKMMVSFFTTRYFQSRQMHNQKVNDFLCSIYVGGIIESRSLSREVFKCKMLDIAEASAQMSEVLVNSTNVKHRILGIVARLFGMRSVIRWIYNMRGRNR